jgi:hypothetical protein
VFAGCDSCRRRTRKVGSTTTRSGSVWRNGGFREGISIPLNFRLWGRPATVTLHLFLKGRFLTYSVL